MRLNRLIIATVCIVTMPALGVPLARFNEADRTTHGPSFTHMSRAREPELKPILASLMQQEDQRKPISSVYKSFGLSQTELRQAMTSTGIIGCPPTASMPYYSAGVGALVGNSRDMVITAGHVMVDREGRARRCFFSPYAGPKRRFWLSDKSSDRAVGTDIRDYNFVPHDYAIVRLITPVRNAIPYQVSLDIPRMRTFETLITISGSFKWDLRSRTFIQNREPRAQVCRVRYLFDAQSDDTNTYITDCDELHGDSGSIQLIRSKGQLYIRGLISGYSGDKERCVFDMGSCSTRSVEVVAPIIAAIASMGGLQTELRRHAPPTGLAPAPDAVPRSQEEQVPACVDAPTSTYERCKM